MRRPYLQLIQSAGEDVGVRFRVIEAGFVYKAEREGTGFVMHNVDPGLNDSSAAALARSKSSASAALRDAGIPAVEHRFLLNAESKYATADPRELAIRALDEFGGQAVVKRDDGSQGDQVYLAEDATALRAALDAIFALRLDAAISPYRAAECEYRVVVLDGQARLMLGKRRGASWKHNLSGGASAFDADEGRQPELRRLAVDSAAALGLIFCTVDMLDAADGLQVLEVNGNVFLSEYVGQRPERAKTVRELFRDVFELKFGWLRGRSRHDG